MASVADKDMSSTRVMFLVGRMNPPTPGHIYGLCIPFLRAVREKSIDILTEREQDYQPEESLVSLTRKAKLVPRLFLTNSTNEKRISYLSLENSGLYNKVTGIVDKKQDEDKQNGIFYVKDKNLENPLTPEEKKLFVVRMLLNAMDTPEQSDIKVNEADLQYLIVCQTEGVESWCAAFGPASAIKCSLRLSKPEKYDNLHFFMGEDEDPTEMNRRMKFCLGNEIENDEGEKVNCITVPRLNIQREERQAEQVADTTSMSASKIRILMANKNIDEIIRLYEGLLSENNVCELIDRVCRGMRLISPFNNLEEFPRCKTRAMPPQLNRASARLRGAMPSSGLGYDDTTGKSWDSRKGGTRKKRTRKKRTRKKVKYTLRKHKVY